MRPELKTPCPCCGGPMSWCGEVPTDDDPNGHDCDQLTCTACQYNIDFHSDDVRVAETYEGACAIVAARWNARFAGAMATVTPDPDPARAARGYDQFTFPDGVQEVHRSCGDGCNGCEQCTDYSDSPAERVHVGDPVALAVDVLFESAKQHRSRGDGGHAAFCDAAAKGLHRAAGGMEAVPVPEPDHPYIVNAKLADPPKIIDPHPVGIRWLQQPNGTKVLQFAQAWHRGFMEHAARRAARSERREALHPSSPLAW